MKFGHKINVKALYSFYVYKTYRFVTGSNDLFFIQLVVVTYNQQLAEVQQKCSFQLKEQFSFSVVVLVIADIL